MTTLRLMLPTGRALVALDAMLAIWVAFWIWLGVAVGHEVSGLRHLSATVTKDGQAVAQTGAALRSLGTLPLVGTQLGSTATQIEDAGRATEQSGVQSRRSVHNLSWMLALAIALIPSMPVVGFYLPLRWVDARERRRLRALAEAHDGDAAFERFLAHRALFTLPYQRLGAMRGEPWRDYANGRFDGLAETELRRLGVEDLHR